MNERERTQAAGHIQKAFSTLEVPKSGSSKANTNERLLALVRQMTGEDLSGDTPATVLVAALSELEARFPKTSARILHDVLPKKHAIRPEDIPEPYLVNEIRRELMRADPNHEEPKDSLIRKALSKKREGMARRIIRDQTETIREWSDWATGEGREERYPLWFRYLVVRKILALSNAVQVDEEKGIESFKTRSATTINPVPELDREALADVRIALEEWHKKKPADRVLFTGDDAWKNDALETYGMAKLYRHEYARAVSARFERSQEIKGEWIVFSGVEDAQKLRDISRGTGWCFRNPGTAESYLTQGPVHVYATLGKDGTLVGRIGIAFSRKKDGSLSPRERRGASPDGKQHLEGQFVPIMREHLTRFPGAEEHLKKLDHAEMLERLYHAFQKARKTKGEWKSSPEELRFLYEIDESIQSFGYGRDRRIDKLLRARDPEEDMLVIFDCEPHEIGRTEEDLNKPGIRAWVGEIAPKGKRIKDFFNRLPKSVEHIYTSFPEGKVRIFEFVFQGETPEELLSEIRALGMKVSGWAEEMALAILKSGLPARGTHIRIAVLTNKQMGFPNGTERKNIFNWNAKGDFIGRAAELGLRECPAIAALLLRKKLQNQSGGEWLIAGMKPITDRGGDLYVFSVGHGGDDSWLFDNRGNLGHHWNSGGHFFFALAS